MLPNEPIDILAIASERLYYWDCMVNCVMHGEHSMRTQQLFDNYWSERRIACDDMDAVQTLIRELSR